MENKTNNKELIGAVLFALAALAFALGVPFVWEFAPDTPTPTTTLSPGPSPTPSPTETWSVLPTWTDFPRTLPPNTATLTNTPTATLTPSPTSTRTTVVLQPSATSINAIFQTATANAEGKRGPCYYIAQRTLPIQNCIGASCDVIGTVPDGGRFYQTDDELRIHNDVGWHQIVGIEGFLTDEYLGRYGVGYVPFVESPFNDVETFYNLSDECDLAPSPTPEIFPTESVYLWMLADTIKALNVRRPFPNGSCLNTDGSAGASVGHLDHRIVSHRQLYLSGEVWVKQNPDGTFNLQYRKIEGAVSTTFPQQYLGMCVATGSQTTNYLTPS